MSNDSSLGVSVELVPDPDGVWVRYVVGYGHLQVGLTLPESAAQAFADAVAEGTRVELGKGRRQLVTDVGKIIAQVDTAREGGVA